MFLYRPALHPIADGAVCAVCFRDATILPHFRCLVIPYGLFAFFLPADPPAILNRCFIPAGMCYDIDCAAGYEKLAERKQTIYCKQECSL